VILLLELNPPTAAVFLLIPPPPTHLCQTASTHRRFPMNLDDGEGDEDVAGAGAMFKANAKHTKNRIISSAPLLAVSAAAVDVGVLRQALSERSRWCTETG